MKVFVEWIGETVTGPKQYSPLIEKGEIRELVSASHGCCWLMGNESRGLFGVCSLEEVKLHHTED